MSPGYEGDVTTSSPAALCFLVPLAFHSELRKVSFSFLVGNRRSFETSRFSAKWLSVHISSGTRRVPEVRRKGLFVVAQPGLLRYSSPDCTEQAQEVLCDRNINRQETSREVRSG